MPESFENRGPVSDHLVPRLGRVTVLIDEFHLPETNITLRSFAGA